MATIVTRMVCVMTLLILGAWSCGGGSDDDDRECYADKECPVETPYCVSGGVCVECSNEFKHCNDGLVCNHAKKKCVNCTTNSDCVYRYGLTFTCEKSKGLCDFILKK